MSIRNLDFVFKPRSIALVGASKEKGSIGAVVAHNLFNSGFMAPIMPVNPKHRAIEGVLTYSDAASLPEVPDLAVVATPPDAVPGLVEAFGARGTRGIVVITAGFGEGGDSHGSVLRQAMLDSARRHMVRIVGPNCIGVIVPGAGLNASFAHLHPHRGHLAFVAQSGAVATSVLDWAAARAIGFSHVVSLGDMIDVDFGDMLDYLAGEAEVRGILLYIEAVTHARKFMSAARAAARLKPVVVIKSGRHPGTVRAVASHTGAMAGEDAVYDAAFRRAGMLRVHDIGDLFGAVETLSMGRTPAGDRLAVLTNGGGIGVMAMDALLDRGGQPAPLADSTMAALNRILPPAWSHDNPVDILGDADGKRYSEALAVLLEDPNTDAVLVLKCPTAISSGEAAAKAIIATAGAGRRRCILTCWLGEQAAQSARHLFGQSRIPTYFTPERAVRAFIDMLAFRRNQEALMQTPPSIPENFAPDTTSARAILQRAQEEAREWLTEPEAKEVLQAYRIPVVPTQTVADPRAAAAAAASLAGSVALKILSRDITHKSDVRGVILDLRSPTQVREAAQAMIERVQHGQPDAVIDGFTVQPMVERPEAFELIIGVSEDPQFGPVILFGHGGTAAEVIADKVLALPPLNMHLAHDAIARTRVFSLLRGFRGRQPAAIDDIALTLIKVSQLVIDFPEVAELDINPLLADEYGVLALDARIRVHPAQETPANRLAIRPYPKELEETIALPDGRNFMLRPVRPEDEPAFQDLFSKLSPEDIRMRFFAPKKALTHPFAARLTQIDYDREMALVLAEPGIPGRSTVYGTVHIAADPDGDRAEYAIMLRSDLAGLGLGPLLMRRIIDYSRQRGLQELFGEVLRENRAMLRVCERLGFKRSAKPDDPGVFEVTLDLREHRPAASAGETG